MHNQKGSTYLSRYFFVLYLPNFTKQTVELCLEFWKRWPSTSKTSGIQAYKCQPKPTDLASLVWKVILNFIKRLRNLNVHMSMLAHVKDLAMCPECLAGMPGFRFTDVADQPAWLETVGTVSLGRMKLPTLSAAYRSVTNKILQCSAEIPFHLLKFGFARDLAAGIIVQLCTLGYFDIGIDDGDSRSVEERLGRAFGHFNLWCLATSKQKHLKKLYPRELEISEKFKSTFSECQGRWCYIGVDLVVICSDWFLREPLAARSLTAFECNAANNTRFPWLYWRYAFARFVVATMLCPKVLCRAGFRLVRGYCYLADYSVKNKLIGGYNLRPKLHYFHHSLIDMQKGLQNSSRKWFLNHASWNCEANEDYIGRQARISRRVDARTCSLRTLERYLVKVRAVMARHKWLCSILITDHASVGWKNKLEPEGQGGRVSWSGAPNMIQSTIDPTYPTWRWRTWMGIRKYM